jgi:hypothetical protein
VATFHAGAAIGETLAKLLERALPTDDAIFRGVSCAFLLSLASPPPLAVTVYLYRVALSTSRNHFQPRSTSDGARRYRQPLPVDFYYLLTAWSADAARQASLLLWAMRQVEDVAVLPAGLLNGVHGTSQHVFHEDESVHVALEGISLQDAVAIWEPAKASMRASVACVARAVPVESEESVAAGAEVQTRELRFEERAQR